MSVPPLVIMGVSGCGKTTVGQGLAERVPDSVFIDADDLHPAANVEKMRSGVPLTDVDRAPWLDAVGRAMREASAAGRTPIVACSALKRAYRLRILAEEPDAFFVLLDVDRAELERRMRERKHHYMPASLLDSQLATLERLGPDEPGTTVPIVGPGGEVVESVLARVVDAR
jgi:gluconokinase